MKYLLVKFRETWWREELQGYRIMTEDEFETFQEEIRQFFADQHGATVKVFWTQGGCCEVCNNPGQYFNAEDYLHHLTIVKLAEWEAETIIEHLGKQYGDWMDPRERAIDVKNDSETDKDRCPKCGQERCSTCYGFHCSCDKEDEEDDEDEYCEICDCEPCEC